MNFATRLLGQLLAPLLGVVLAVSGLVALSGSARAAGDPCASGGNPIVCENSKPGSPPSEWDVDGAGDSDIQGFATDISVDAGSTIRFKIDTSASAYSITIYRTGWYGGDGARKVATVTPSATLPQTQPNCLWDATTELTDCGNWAVSASWDVPSTAVSGVYIARLERADNHDASHITFIVRDDASHSDVVYQTSDPTWEAYNAYGGSDFYKGAANGRAYKVSYNRPFATRTGTTAEDFYFQNEYPLVRFLERNGYDVSYIAGVDTDRSGQLLTNHKVFLSVGHDEYWSGAQRANVEAARDAGVNLQFLSGNEVYWRTRYEPSVDGSATPYRTLVTYKEAWSQAKIDPSPQSTSTWRDPRYAPKSQGGGRPENALTGTIFMSNLTDLPLTVTRAQAQLRLWRGTGLDQMSGASTALAPHTVGYESDEDQDNGSRPPGTIDLSTTTGNIVGQYMTDFGKTTGDGTTTHSITLYRAASGALVFGAGSVQWTWGLDATHDSPYHDDEASPAMQQAEVNLLADQGAQPATLMSGLTAATRSTDTTGPTVTITAPAEGSAQPNGTKVTLTGTASDVGGAVAGVEYSTDDGTTWHPAKGTSAWTAEYVQHGIGSTPVKVRAVDDSANIGDAATRRFAVTCGCGLFGNGGVPTTWTSVVGPATPSSSDPSAAELGLRFTPMTDGYVAGVRFYKGSGNIGTHVGSLWSSSGERLAQVMFADETDAGWQQATFQTPVAVTAGQSYVVSYTDPSGHYAVQPWAFAEQGIDAYPLEVDGGFGADAAGVYANPGTFPSRSSKNSNYYVDVVFSTTDDSPLTAVSQWPLADSSSVPRSTTVSAKFSKPVVSSSVHVDVKDALGDVVAGATSYDSATRVVTFTPSAALAGFVRYTVTLSGADTVGSTVTNGRSWSFTTAKPPATVGVCPCSLYDDDDVPTVLEDPQHASLTLGVRFHPTVSGTITGVRFYKAVNNTAPHTGTLWSSAGTVLAQGTFTGESTTGWQTLRFSQPVEVQAGTEYVAAYHTSSAYSATPNAFAASDLSKGPLAVTSTAGAWASGDHFPSSASASSYLVDVVFEKGAPTLSMTRQDPAPGAVSVPRSVPVAVTFSTPIGAGYSLGVTSGSTTIAGATSLNDDGQTLTFTPSDLLPADADVTVTLAGVSSQEGAALGPQTWTFHTRAPDSPTSETLFGAQLPTTAAVGDASPVEVGTAFSPTRDGAVTGVRFFKGTGNGGTHTGSLWTADGARLATVTFPYETATGWQQADFSSPVRVSAGTTYVISYLAPQGHYAATPQFFSTPYAAGHLSAPAKANGRYLYGASGGFPTYSYQATNYFVDAVFEPDPPTIAVTGRTPTDGATGVVRTSRPQISFDTTLRDGWSMSVSMAATPLGGTAALSADKQTLTFTPSAALPDDTLLTVSVSGVVSTEGARLPTQSWSFRTETVASVLTSLLDGTTPATVDSGDARATELGMSFTPSVGGDVTAIRFYKAAANTGTHTGSVWSSSGTRLATVTFTGETASGWQTAQLSTPLTLTAGQTYVVSYFAPKGHYSVTGAYFRSARTVGVLTAPATTNGRYLYAAGGGFPTASYNASSYFVDVVFRSPAS